MSPSNVHGFATNRETLLFLAWIAGRPNLSDLQTCQLRGKEPHRVFPAQLTVSLPPIFELDTYGPMYQALFFHRLAEVEWTFVDWAIRGVHAVYLQTDEMPPTGEETTILWETISQQKQIQAEFHQMKEIWLHDPAGLIYHLRAHFQMHQPLLIRSIESAFLVQEFLAISLARVDWRAIAALVLDLPLEQMPPAPKPEEEQSTWPQLQFALLRESLWLAERTFGDFGGDFWASDKLDRLCLGLANTCLDIRRELEALREAGEIDAPDHSASPSEKAEV